MAGVISPGTGQLDMVLSNFAKGYRNGAFITDYLFPRLPVGEQSAKYVVFGRENFRNDVQTRRAPGTRAAQTRGRSESRLPYFCSSHALEGFIPDERKKAYKFGDLTQATATFNQQKILLDREVRAAAKASNPANFAVSNTVALSGGAQWDQAGSDPVSNVELIAKPQITLAGVVANTLFLSYDVAQALRVNAKIIARYQGVLAVGALSDSQLATIFGVDRVVVASGVLDGDAGTGYIWKNFALLTYTDPGVLTQPATMLGAEGAVLPETVTFGKSFTWIDAPETIGGYGVIIARHPFASAKSDIVSNDWYSDEQITGADAGFLFTNVLAKYN